MDVQVNLLGVLVAGLSSMVIGTFYYADSAFGSEWMKLAKIDKKHFQKQMPRLMPWIFVGALVTAYVVAYFAFLYHSFFGDSWLAASLSTSLILWLGLSATTLFIHDAMDQRRRMLTVISMANRLLSLLAMGAIIGLIHP